MKALNYPILNNEFERVGMMLQGEYSHPEIVEDLESGFPTFSVTVSKTGCEDISKIQDNTYTLIDGEIYSLLSSDDVDRHEKDLFYEHWAVPFLQAEAESIEEPTSDQDAGFYFEKTLEDTPISLGSVEVQKKKTLAFSSGKVGSRLHDLYREFGVEPVFKTRFNPYDPDMPVGITLDLVLERGSKETGIVLDSETNLIKINRKMNKDDLLTGIKVKPFTREETVKKTVKTAQQSVEIKAQPKVEQAQTKHKPAWPTTSGLPITSSYGPRRSPTAGASNWHAAIDIGGNGVNHPIYATQDGKVTHSHYNQYGNTIRIKHTADKYYSQYMHLASRSVSVGDTVKRGQRIGTMGTTGISTGIHLDFAISKNGTFYQQSTTIDPREYLKMEFTSGTPAPAQDDGLPEKTRKQLAYFETQAGGTYTQSGARNNYIDNQGRIINKAPADCSSIVYKSLIFAGIPCGFSANNAWKGTTYTLRDQSGAGQYFNIVNNWNQLEPGDIILCNNWGHVVTYVGGGRVFHASKPGVPHGYASASTYKSRVNRILRPKDRGSRTVKKTQSTTQRVDSTLIGGSNKDQIWVHLKNIGYGDIQAAAIMGNLYQESRYDPKAQQGGGRLPGRGLAQWSVHERWQDLLSYASSEGLDPWSIEAQVKFIHREMRYGYISSRMNSRASWYGGQSGAHGYEAFSTVNDITKATEFFCKEFEIAGVELMSVRVNEAKKVYKDYKGTYQGGEESSVTVGDTKYTTKEVSEKEEVTYSIKDIILEEDDFYSFQGQETIYSRKAQQRFGFNQQNKSYYLMGVHEMNSTNITGEFESALLKLKEKSSPFEEYIVDLDTTDPDTREALQSVELGDKIRVTSHGWERNQDLVLVARVSQVIRRPGERENIGVRITDAERLEVFLPDHIRALQERIARADAEDFDRMQVVLRSDIVNFIGQGDETEIIASVRNSGADYTHQIPDAEFKWQVYDKNGIPISETEEHDIVIGEGLQNDAGNTTWRTAELVDGNRYRIHPTIIGTELRFDTYDVDGNPIDSTEWLDDKEDVVYVAPPFASYMVVEAKTNPSTRPFQVLAEATPLIMEGKKVFINADMVDERITVTCRVREAEGSISLSKTDYTHTGPNPPSDYRPGSEYLKEVPGTGIYDENGNWTGDFEKLMFDGHEWVNQDVTKLEKELELEFFELDKKLDERNVRQQAILEGLGVGPLSETHQEIVGDILNEKERYEQLVADAKEAGTSAGTQAEQAFTEAEKALTSASSALSGLSTTQEDLSNLVEIVNDPVEGLSSKAKQTIVEEINNTVSEHTTQISQNATDISSKAEQSIVDGINQTVENQGTQISQNASDISSKADKSVVDTLSGTVETNSTNISQNATDIQSKADQSVVDTLTGEVQANATAITQNATEISSLANKTITTADGKTTTWDTLLKQTAEGLSSKADNVVVVDGVETTLQSYIEQTAEGLKSDFTSITDENGNVIVKNNSMIQSPDGTYQRWSEMDLSGKVSGYQDVVETSDLFSRTLGSTEEGISDNISSIVQGSEIIQLSVGEAIKSERKGMIGDVILENSNTQTLASNRLGVWYLNRSLIVGSTYYARMKATIQPTLFVSMADEELRFSKVSGTTDEWELFFEYSNGMGEPTHVFYVQNKNSAAGQFQILELYESDPEAIGTVLSILSNSGSIRTQNLIGDTLAELGIINSDGYFSGDRFMFTSDVNIAPDFTLSANHIRGNIMELTTASFVAEDGTTYIDPYRVESYAPSDPLKAYPRYRADRSYKTNNMVYHNGRVYKARRDSKNKEPWGTATAYWETVWDWDLEEPPHPGALASMQNGVFFTRAPNGNSMGYLGYLNRNGRDYYALNVSASRNFGIITGGTDVVFEYADYNKQLQAGRNLSFNSGYGVIQSSDRRLKYDVEPTEVNPEKIMEEAKFSSFTYYDSDIHLDIGMVAQDNMDLTVEGEDGYLAIDTMKLNYVTAYAVQKLLKRVKELEERIG